MFNTKLIFTALLLFNLHMPQLKTGPGTSCLQTTNNVRVFYITNKAPKTLIGEKSESKNIPEHFKFKSKQKVTLSNIPDDPKIMIGQYLGFDKPSRENGFSSRIEDALVDHDCNAIQILVALGAHLHRKKHGQLYYKQQLVHKAVQAYHDGKMWVKNIEHRNHLSSRIYVDSHTGNLYKPQEPQQALAIINYFIQNKIPINEIGVLGQTPIYIAINYKLVNIVQRLIIAGADLTISDSLNQTALDSARKNAMKPLHLTCRKKLYQICTILEQAKAPSSIALPQMPTDEVIKEEYIIGSLFKSNER